MFQEFIGHNELGLALDELAHAADGLPAGPEFWSLLRLAADEMDLTEADTTHGSAVQIINRHRD